MLPVAGVFFFVGIHPNTQCFASLVQTDEAGFVITDERMGCFVGLVQPDKAGVVMGSPLPGVFAAGDVRSKILRQIATAVGDGAMAAYSANCILKACDRIDTNLRMDSGILSSGSCSKYPYLSGPMYQKGFASK